MRMTTIATLLTFAALPAAATDYQTAMQDYLENNIQSWAQAPVLVTAIARQNAETQGYSQHDINLLDKQWRAAVEAAKTEPLAPVLQNAAADFLRQQISLSDGRITEIFIMDAQGLNVAASGATSDFWQGDEAKFQKTYYLGKDATHIGAVELDQSSRLYQAQISLTISDTNTGVAIGAMTVGVDADSLM
ncbi:hypothetical protein [Pseudophaeobacter sp.]|uniref:hypothetical protein n=1 Tax=Pseudophaeobacter sp. TaxID=1971739 RepID=UPI0032976FA6